MKPCDPVKVPEEIDSLNTGFLVPKENIEALCAELNSPIPPPRRSYQIMPSISVLNACHSSPPDSRSISPTSSQDEELRAITALDVIKCRKEISKSSVFPRAIDSLTPEATVSTENIKSHTANKPLSKAVLDKFNMTQALSTRHGLQRYSIASKTDRRICGNAEAFLKCIGNSMDESQVSNPDLINSLLNDTKNCIEKKQNIIISDNLNTRVRDRTPNQESNDEADEVYPELKNAICTYTNTNIVSNCEDRINSDEDIISLMSGHGGIRKEIKAILSGGCTVPVDESLSYTESTSPLINPQRKQLFEEVKNHQKKRLSLEDIEKKIQLSMFESRKGGGIKKSGAQKEDDQKDITTDISKRVEHQSEFTDSTTNTDKSRRATGITTIDTSTRSSSAFHSMPKSVTPKRQSVPKMNLKPCFVPSETFDHLLRPVSPKLQQERVSFRGLSPAGKEECTEPFLPNNNEEACKTGFNFVIEELKKKFCDKTDLLFKNHKHAYSPSRKSTFQPQIDTRSMGNTACNEDNADRINVRTAIAKFQGIVNNKNSPNRPSYLKSRTPPKPPNKPINNCVPCPNLGENKPSFQNSKPRTPIITVTSPTPESVLPKPIPIVSSSIKLQDELLNSKVCTKQDRPPTPVHIKYIPITKTLEPQNQVTTLEVSLIKPNKLTQDSARLLNIVNHELAGPQKDGCRKFQIADTGLTAIDSYSQRKPPKTGRETLSAVLEKPENLKPILQNIKKLQDFPTCTPLGARSHDIQQKACDQTARQSLSTSSSEVVAVVVNKPAASLPSSSCENTTSESCNKNSRVITDTCRELIQNIPSSRDAIQTAIHKINTSASNRYMSKTKGCIAGRPHSPYCPPNCIGTRPKIPKLLPKSAGVSLTNKFTTAKTRTSGYPQMSTALYNESPSDSTDYKEFATIPDEKKRKFSGRCVTSPNDLLSSSLSDNMSEFSGSNLQNTPTSSPKVYTSGLTRNTNFVHASLITPTHKECQKFLNNKLDSQRGAVAPCHAVGFRPVNVNFNEGFKNPTSPLLAAKNLRCSSSSDRVEVSDVVCDPIYVSSDSPMSTPYNIFKDCYTDVYNNDLSNNKRFRGLNSRLNDEYYQNCIPSLDSGDEEMEKLKMIKKRPGSEWLLNKCVDNNRSQAFEKFPKDVHFLDGHQPSIDQSSDTDGQDLKIFCTFSQSHNGDDPDIIFNIMLNDDDHIQSPSLTSLISDSTGYSNQGPTVVVDNVTISYSISDSSEISLLSSKCNSKIVQNNDKIPNEDFNINLDFITHFLNNIIAE